MKTFSPILASTLELAKCKQREEKKKNVCVVKHWNVSEAFASTTAFPTSFDIKTIISGRSREKIKVKELNRELDIQITSTHSHTWSSYGIGGYCLFVWIFNVLFVHWLILKKILAVWCDWKGEQLMNKSNVNRCKLSVRCHHELHVH